MVIVAMTTYSLCGYPSKITQPLKERLNSEWVTLCTSTTIDLNIYKDCQCMEIMFGNRRYTVTNKCNKINSKEYN